jgi:hypothetical protein
LSIPASKLTKLVQLLGGFDMLGDAIVPRSAAQLEHPAEQGKAVIDIGHGGDKRPVEFDSVELDLA